MRLLCNNSHVYTNFGTQYDLTLIKCLLSIFVVQHSYRVFKTPPILSNPVLLILSYCPLFPNQLPSAPSEQLITVPHKYHTFVYTFTYEKIFHCALHSLLEYSNSPHLNSSWFPRFNSSPISSNYDTLPTEHSFNSKWICNKTWLNIKHFHVVLQFLIFKSIINYLVAKITSHFSFVSPTVFTRLLLNKLPTHCFLSKRAVSPQKGLCFIKEYGLWRQLELGLTSLPMLTNNVASGQF